MFHPWGLIFFWRPEFMERINIGYVIFLASLYIESDPIYFSWNIWRTIFLTVCTLFDEYIPTTDKVMALDIFSLTFSVALWEEMARDPKKPFFNITQMVWACPLVSREQIKTARHDCIFNNIEIFRELWNLQDMLTTISKFDLNSFWV